MGPHMAADAAQKFRYFGGWADKIQGLNIKTWGGPAHDYVAYEPYGVIGAIIPWNGPLFAATMVIAPALAAGNCVVLKAPELAPYSVMRLAEIAMEAGFPPGVINMVVGGPDAGEAMVSHAGNRQDPVCGFGGHGQEGARQCGTILETLRTGTGRQIGGDRLCRCGSCKRPQNAGFPAR